MSNCACQCACVRVDMPDNMELQTLLRHVATSVPSCPHDVMMNALRQSYIEFARKSKLLVSHYTLHTQRGVKDYELVPPAGYEMFGLVGIANENYNYLSYPNVDTWFFGWGVRFRLQGTRLIFEEAPSRDKICNDFALHLIPNECTDDIPRQIAVPYGKGIAMGALADLLEIPNQGWTNTKIADWKRKEFHRVTAQATAAYYTNNGAQKPMMKPIRIL